MMATLPVGCTRTPDILAMRLPGHYPISPWSHALVQVYEYQHKLYPVVQMTFVLHASTMAISGHRRSQSEFDRVQPDVDRSLGVFHVRKYPTKRPDQLFYTLIMSLF